MNETELESLVVRLLGDGSSYVKMLRDAETGSKNTADAVAVQGKRIEEFQTSLKGFGQAAVGALGVLGITTSLKSAFESYSEMEKGMLKLNAAIETNGGNAKELSGRYYELATSIAEVTTMSKGDVMGLARQAETMGMSGDAAERLMRNSIALSGATDQSTHSSMMMLMAMERGNMHMLRRIPALRGITNETEILNKVNQLLKSGWEQQIAAANTTGGRLERLGKFVNSLKKQVGELVEMAIRPAVKWLTQAAEWFKKLDPTVQKIVVGTIALVGAFVAAGPAINLVSMLIGPLTASFTMLSAAMRMVGVSSTLMMGPKGWILLAIVIAVIAAVSLVVEHMGGWKKTWEAVQKGASDFWEWLQPTIKQIQEVFVAAWAAISAVAMFVWDGIKAVVAGVGEFIGSIIQSAGISWDQFRDAATIALKVISTAIAIAMAPFTGGLSLLFVWVGGLEDIRDRFLMIGFAVQNIEPVANLAWAGIKYGFMNMVASVEEFFTGQTPTWIDGFRQEFVTQLNIVTTQFNAYRQRILAPSPAANKKAENAGAELGQNFNKGMKGEHGKMDAVLANSAEAMSRIAAFQDRLTAGHGPAAMSPEQRVANTIRDAGTAVNAMQQRTGTASESWLTRLTNMASNVWNTIRDGAARVWETILFIWNNLPAIAADVWNRITTFASNAWDMIQGSAIAQWEYISTLAQQSWEAFDEWASGAIDQIAEDFFFIWDNFPEIAETMWNDLLASGTEMWDEVSEWFFTTLPASIGEAAAAWLAWGITFFSTTLPVGIAEFFQNAQTVAATFFSVTLPNFATTAWNRIVEIVREVISNITGSGIARSVTNFTGGLQERVTTLVGGGSGQGGNNGQNRDLLGQAVNFLGQMANNVFQVEPAGL